MDSNKLHSGKHAIANTMLVLLTLIWGMTFPATKIAVQVTDPIHFIALRFILASFLLIPFLLTRIVKGNGGKPVSRAPSKPDNGNVTIVDCAVTSRTADNLLAYFSRRSLLVRGALVGTLLCIGFSLQVTGMKFTTASRSGFFTGLLVVMVPPIAYMVRTSKAPVSSWIGIAPALVGIYLLADPKTGGMNLGDWLTIACAFVFAFQMVFLEAVAGPAADAWKLTAIQVFVIAIGATSLSLISGNQFRIEAPGWVAVGYTALFGTLIAVWLQTRFQPDLPAAHAALVFTLEPVFAGFFAWLLLGDQWTTRSLLGAALILIAMAVSSAGIRRAAGESNITTRFTSGRTLADR